MNSAITQFLTEQVPRFTKSLADFEARIDPQAEPQADATLVELTKCFNDSLAECAQLEEELAAEDPAVLKQAQADYRAAIWPWISKSWCMNRSIAKPRGYPGDYQLLTTIYNNQPKSTGFSGYLDLYWLNLTLARAVVGRMISLRHFLVSEFARRDGKIAALNVACGACRELTQDFQIPKENVVALTCLDNDDEALDYLRANVAPNVPENLAIDYVRYNALRMTSAQSNVRRFGNSDVIYSVGLLDYIPDEYLVPLLEGWRLSLAEGGVVYVAFKDCKLYDKSEYQWLLDWFFFQRTEDDCRRLFIAAGYDMNLMETTRDSTGVIINFLYRSKVGSPVRVDSAQALPIPQHVDAGVVPADSHASH